jgi:hypothetical protein
LFLLHAKPLSIVGCSHCLSYRAIQKLSAISFLEP